LKTKLFGFFLLLGFFAIAQPKQLLNFNKDSTQFSLSDEGAAYLASLPLKCILQPYPNKINHTAISDSDQVLTPIQQHPSFYGCFDWHSSVHGHWMLVELLKKYPHLSNEAAIRKVLSTTLTAANIQIETNYFKGALSRSFERTYGWAWLLKLQESLITWNDPDAKKWSAALNPLCDTVINLWRVFLPKQTYPNRTGVHPNTAFGFSFALDYARTVHNTAFEQDLIKSAKQLYLKDKAAPTKWEPDGSDFFSASLMEADLMRKVLNKPAFIEWFNTWLTLKDLEHVSEVPKVSDRTDLQIVHLDGLCFSRSWCMAGIAKSLPALDKRRTLLLKASSKLLKASLPNVVSGNYGGEHWLASFAVYAILEQY
jgi:hypothetical protein